MKHLSSVILLLTLLSLDCQPIKPTAQSYPPADSFNLATSDPKAVSLADAVMQAQGGYQNWLKTRYFSWNFFGKRQLLWDKQTGNVRIETEGNEANTIILNLQTGQGKAERNGSPITDPTELAERLQTGKEIWINDSYWLLMPYKLKDSGVTLRYIGEATTEANEPAQVLQLTFESVGVTPENKYLVYISNASNLVVQWSYFKHFEDQTPAFTTPWSDYRTYANGIKLASNRGNRSLSDIATPAKVPQHRFEEL